MGEDRNGSQAPEKASKTAYLYPLLLAIFTLATRLVFHGPVYFADGPAHVQSILDKVYVIQPPGYWLFNHTAGLFGDPTLAISAMNILFSVAGVVVFYLAACFFCGRRVAFTAALAYSCIFFLWFAGEVHSTYASQAFSRSLLSAHCSAMSGTSQVGIWALLPYCSRLERVFDHRMGCFCCRWLSISLRPGCQSIRLRSFLALFLSWTLHGLFPPAWFTAAHREDCTA